MSSPPLKYNIRKQDGGQSLVLDKSIIPPEGMPSGPGFKGGKQRRRTAKTFPKGILRKIMPTSNPTKPPSTRKSSVRIVSDKFIKAARTTAKKRVGSMKIKDIREKLVKNRIIPPHKKDVPGDMLRLLYSNGIGAGLIN